jgi:hypothetical protein
MAVAAVLVLFLAMIGGENDQGLVEQPALAQERDELRELRVDIGDLFVVEVREAGEVLGGKVEPGLAVVDPAHHRPVLPAPSPGVDPWRAGTVGRLGEPPGGIRRRTRRILGSERTAAGMAMVPPGCSRKTDGSRAVSSELVEGKVQPAGLLALMNTTASRAKASRLGLVGRP